MLSSYICLLCYIMCVHGLVELLPIPYMIASIIIYTYYKYIWGDDDHMIWFTMIMSVMFAAYSKDISETLSFYLTLDE